MLNIEQNWDLLRLFNISLFPLGFWFGISLTVMMTLMFMYTSWVLVCNFLQCFSSFDFTKLFSKGKCWVILQRRWPVYRRHCRQPYPEIGGRAMGPWLKSESFILIRFLTWLRQRRSQDFFGGRGATKSIFRGVFSKKKVFIAFY